MAVSILLRPGGEDSERKSHVPHGVESTVTTPPTARTGALAALTPGRAAPAATADVGGGSNH
ncbi:hypothetical protein [Streptomyces sp. NPDC017993]|uniref:hypothetical protein n=1 Tax=Streptomyces sp. NPDC017993 TaxID=3365027 RepID=UPI0037B64E63